MATLRIDYPEDLVRESGHTKGSLEALAREALLVRLYDLGRISSGRAAEVLGVTRREFLDLLSRYNVSEFDESLDLAAEAHRATAASRLGHEPTD